ncbi:MAG: efflux RND transporter periplasmic adaptor subunit [Sphingosinicella sp.]|nr:efflux RND transporter periplasmic adaptor subunit [Sphingosinicella sp.]
MYHSFPKGEADPVRGEQLQPATPADHLRRLPRRVQLGLAGLAVAVVGIGGATLLGGGDAQAGPPPMPTVVVSQPLQRSIVEWDEYTGRFEASQAVEIRPRVSGQLVGIHFRDGDFVSKGQLLFTVDPRPFVAQLNEARARAAAALTAVALARSEYARAARLVDDEAVSREEVDSLRAALRSAEAGVGAAQAIVQQRALDLEFTRVRAPISGRISDRRIDVGNIVAGNETPLTTIHSLDPIHFTFDGSEALYLKALRARQSGQSGQQVEIKLQDEAGYSWKGQVDFTDNGIDPRSGTMRGRAVVRNPQHFLAAGMFGNMRLTSGAQTNALLVPDGAVRTDQARKIVLVVAPDGTVMARPIQAGPLVNGLRSIKSGLRPNDKVVISGVQFAMPGSKVNVRPGRISPPAPATILPSEAAPASQATLAAR